MLLPLLTAALHLASLVRPWGYFRDELYYLACADHPAWGYVDHPPLSIALLAAWRAVFGDSLLAIRLPSLLAAAATVLLAGLLARRLGAGVGGRVLAMTAVLACPTLRALAGVYSMNPFDVLLWTLLAYLVAGLLLDDATAATRRWLGVGLVAGLGLLNKLSMLWLLGGLAVGVLATRRRRWLATPGPWLAAGLATAFPAPHVAWQVGHGWPTLEFMRNAGGDKMVRVAPLDFLAGQVMSIGPPLALLAVVGLVGLFRLRRGAVRPLGVAALAVLALLAFNGTSRASYMAPAYPLLLAAGAATLAGWLRSPSGRPSGARPWHRVALGAAIALVAAFGALVAPLTLPLTTVETYVSYSRALGVAPDTEERKEVGALPQFFADRFGWPELAAEVERIYRSLPPEERAVVSVFTSNYGEAGAVDHFARALPPALSGHNAYWTWGPRGQSGEVLIAVLTDGDSLRAAYEEVEQAGRTSCRWCMPYEDGVPIWVARRPRTPLAEAWPLTRHFE